MRISRPQMFMEMAKVVAKRSTCMRLSVGAVVVYNRRVVSIGYNGVPAGSPHCTGNDCPGKFGCTLTTHAEENAILYSPWGIASADIYVTNSPCQSCAEKIVQARFKRVFFEIPYRVTEPMGWLRKAKIEVYRITPAGHILEWGTDSLVEIET